MARFKTVASRPSMCSWYARCVDLTVMAGICLACLLPLQVEHDLAVLDYMSDTVCCLYGEPGAYGVVTKIASVRNGINNFLAG